MWGIEYLIVREAEVGLQYENGRYVRTLTPGRYRLSNWPWRRQEIVRVDVRRTALTLSGQEMLTADAISVRMNVAAEYRVLSNPAPKGEGFCSDPGGHRVWRA